MKRKITNLLIITSFTILGVLIFLNKHIVTTSVNDSFNIWLSKVFPSLFIMFIITDILIKYNITKYLNLITKDILNKLFNISKVGESIFMLSIISGTPTNAYMINSAIKENKISLDEGNNLLWYTYFPNPLFLYIMLNYIFIDNNIIIKILASFYFSNIILGLIKRKNNKKVINNNTYIYTKFTYTLSNSIKKSFYTVIEILAIITFFMIVCNIITSYITNNTLISITKGILELTTGLESLINISSKAKEIIALTIISFGGLSIHMQVYNIINISLEYTNFLKGRIIGTIISISIYLLIN